MKSKNPIIFSIFLFLIAISPWLFITSLLFLKEPPVWPDEALFVNTAEQLSKTGHLSTNIFGGVVPGMEKHSYWIPPLYFYVLSFWIKVFGSNIEAVRILSSVISFIGLYVVFLIAKLIFKKSSLAALTVFLISIDLSFSRISQIARMDSLNFLFINLAIFSYLASEKKFKKTVLILAGIFSGLAIVTHPLGITAPVIVSLHTLFKQSPIKKKFVTIAFVTVPILLILVIWFLSIKDLNLFLIQNKLQILRKMNESPYVFTLFKSGRSWKLFFIAYFLIVASLFVKFLKNKKSSDLFILIGALVSPLAIIQGKESWYNVYFYPFLSLGAVSLFVSLNKEKLKITRYSILTVIVLIVLLNFYFDFKILEDKSYKNYNYYSFGQQISEAIPDNSTVFLSIIPDPYFILMKRGDLKLYEFSPVPIEEEKQKQLLDSCDYAIINFLPKQSIGDYIEKNIQEKNVISQPNGYAANLIKLLPREKRK